jgi:multidrug transporter EmrE-like cation transporter
MQQLSGNVIVITTLSVIAQVAGIALLPLTRGYTNLLYTTLAIFSFVVGTFFMARLVNSGVNLSFIMPVIAASIPILAIAVGIFFYGEVLPPARLGMLLFACVLIGVANLI